MIADHAGQATFQGPQWKGPPTKTPAEQPSSSVPVPRHLHHRTFRPAIPASKFIVVAPAGAGRVPATVPSRPPVSRRDRKASEPQHKRMVALALLIVALCTVLGSSSALLFLG